MLVLDNSPNEGTYPNMGGRILLRICAGCYDAFPGILVLDRTLVCRLMCVYVCVYTHTHLALESFTGVKIELN